MTKQSKHHPQTSYLSRTRLGLLARGVGLSQALVALLILLSSTSSPAQADTPAALTEATEAIYHGKIDQAYTLVNGYIQANPGDPRGYLVRGNITEWEQKLRNLKGNTTERIIADFEKAYNLSFQAYTRNETDIDINVNLGNSYMRLGKKWGDTGKWMRAALITRKALKHLEFAVEKNPARYDAYLTLGAIRYFTANLPSGARAVASFIGVTGDRAQGIKDITTAAQNANLYQQDARFLLKYVYRKEKRFDQVLTLLKDMHARYPENVEIDLDIGETYHELKRDTEAVTYLTAFTKTCEARETQNKSCHDRFRFTAWKVIGEITLQAKTFDQSIVAFQNAKTLIASGGPSKKEAASVIYHLAEAYEGVHQTNEAIQNYDAVVALGAESKSLQTWVARATTKRKALTQSPASSISAAPKK